MSKHLKTMVRMRNIYDLDDYYVLENEGWKLPQDQTLISGHYKKKDLVEIIRMLEHNWSGAIKQNMLQNARLENFYNYYKKIGQEEFFSNLMNEEVGSE